MTLEADPYRTLGLPRGATLDEVKRAYRRLAKANHPDAAGEAALPRFLAIQAAYEQLIGGPPAPGRGRRASSPRRPWDADPDRSDATRRAYGGRTRGAAPGGRGAASGGSGASGGPGGPSAGEGPARGSGSGPGPERGSGPGSGPRPRPRDASDGAGGAGGRTWTRRPGGAGQGGGTAAQGPGTTGQAAGGAGRTGRTGASEPRQGTGGAAGEAPRGTRSRPPNKATLGSTSYDGADAGPFEPDWGGASWYGTTSGTYWTLNPKEYADPRKHGPEYQARARRTARARARADPTDPRAGADAPDPRAGADAPDGRDTEGPAQDDPAPTADPAEPSTGPTAARDPRARPAGPTHTTTSWWDSTAGPADPPGSGGDHARPDPVTERWRAARGRAARGRAGASANARPGPTDPLPDDRLDEPPPPDLGRATADIARALTDVRVGGMRGRLARAIIGWLPIALGLGWAVGELTGCGRFAASCSGAVEPALLGLQVGVFAVLLAIPVVASIATSAAVALLAAAVVASLILSATGAAADSDSRRVALGLVLLLAWLIGLTVAVARRARILGSPTSPVS